ncbi:Titin [Chlorella sorokiniana]|uniref:Titin n=1 Tax=Chlorella sorokiniana TaxID=3076 RepID=A0A2P6U469_CHLSO|nr:Titin [Chlorella sorokiniana]|eukprot:PRW61106.1 Titin [Chlorella sorokiniana]
MPEPTPPLELPPLAEPAESAAPAPASAAGEHPDRPIGTSSFSRGQRGSSSSGEEAAHPGGSAGSDEAPLLAAGSGRYGRGGGILQDKPPLAVDHCKLATKMFGQAEGLDRVGWRHGGRG